MSFSWENFAVTFTKREVFVFSFTEINVHRHSVTSIVTFKHVKQYGLTRDLLYRYGSDRFVSKLYIAVFLARCLAASSWAHNATPVLCAPSRTSARTCVTKWNRALIIMRRARMLCSLMYVATVNIPHTVYPKPHVNGCIVKTSGHGFLQDSLPTRPRDLFSS